MSLTTISLTTPTLTTTSVTFLNSLTTDVSGLLNLTTQYDGTSPYSLRLDTQPPTTGSPSVFRIPSSVSPWTEDFPFPSVSTHRPASGLTLKRQLVLFFFQVDLRHFSSLPVRSGSLVVHVSKTSPLRTRRTFLTYSLLPPPPPHSVPVVPWCSEVVPRLV